MRALAGCVAAAALAVVLTGCFSAPPQITSLEPNRGSTGVPADSPVRVIFDKPVLHSSVDGRFTVDRSIPGCDFATLFTAPSTAPCSIHWLENAPGFEFRHTGAVFAPLTMYTFTLAGGFTDSQGERNGLDHHWDLTSAPPPRLSSTVPADRVADVGVDAPLAASFTAPMDGPKTAAAISLRPTVSGTRVVRNASDHSRFVILPGQLLQPGITYTIAIDASARGEDEQALLAPASIRFTVGARLESAHAVLLAGASGANATEVLLPALAPAAIGDSIAVPVLMRAPLCSSATGCGSVADHAPLETYEAATVARDGSHIAVVVDDAVTASSVLEVVDTVYNTTVTTAAGGVRPSWSPDGSKLALVTGSAVEVVAVPSGTVTVVEDGVGLTAAPLWSGESTLVLSIGASAAGPGSVQLVNLTVAARYALPGVPPGSTAEAVSAAGDRVAIAAPNGGVLVVPAAGAPGAAQPLPGHLDPLGFSGEGTVIAVNPDTNQLVRVSVAGGDTTTVGLGSGVVDLQTVQVAPDGRRLVYVAADPTGRRQAYVANADGSGALLITRFAGDTGLESQAIGFRY